MKQVLVLGGGGFIGRNIAESLVNRGDCNVTVADIEEGSNWKKLSTDQCTKRRFKAVLADFSDKEAFSQINQNIDEIYMLAAVVGVNKTLRYPNEVIRTNTLLTMNTLNWISTNQIKKLLFASSSENYAGTSELFDTEIPTPETVPLCISDIMHPRWTYAVTKMHGEAAFIHSADALGYDSTIVRYQNIIGPDMGFNHAIPHIVERFVNFAQPPFKVYGHDQTRAFCYIDDAVRGTIGAMENKNSSREIYHIGNEDEVDLKTVATYIGQLLSYEGKYENAETYPGSVSRRCPKIDKAKAHFNYSPRTDWKTAVKLTVEWYCDYFAKGHIPKNGGFAPPEAVLPKLVN